MAEENKKGGVNPITIAIVAAAVIIAVIAVVTQRQTYKPVIAGAKAIDFTLPDLSGKLTRLSDFKGKVVFLNFWATWCEPCKEEMPSMQTLHDGLAGRPFVIVAVSVDKDGPEVVRKFVADNKLTFVVLHDRNKAISETYKTTGVPETFVIDQNGIIAEKVWGPRNWTQDRNLAMVYELLTKGPRKDGAYGASVAK